MEAIKPIETIYNGYRFRSRLEARWAVFFDAAGIEYLYEPEGFRLSDGTMYLPDFYLPESDTFVEIKGVMSKTDEHKISQFLKDSGKAIVIGKDNFHFQACDNWYLEGKDADGSFELASESDSALIQCSECGKYFFMGWTGYFGCQCCGAYDGDHYLRPKLSGNGDSSLSNLKIIRSFNPYDVFNPGPTIGYVDDTIPNAVIRARQARFEHGERP